MSDDAALAARLADEVRGAEGVVALYPAGLRLLGAGLLDQALRGGAARRPEVRVHRHGLDTDVALSIGVAVTAPAPRTAELVRDVVLATLVAAGRIPGTVTVRVSTVG